jgi:hypothetical protein
MDMITDPRRLHMGSSEPESERNGVESFYQYLQKDHGIVAARDTYQYMVILVKQPVIPHGGPHLSADLLEQFFRPGLFRGFYHDRGDQEQLYWNDIFPKNCGR